MNNPRSLIALDWAALAQHEEDTAYTLLGFTPGHDQLETDAIWASGLLNLIEQAAACESCIATLGRLVALHHLAGGAYNASLVEYVAQVLLDLADHHRRLRDSETA